MSDNLVDALSSLYIGENLKTLRTERNLSTTDVAKIIDKSRQGYVNYENGSREISIKDLVTLSKFYNLSIDEIVRNPYNLTSKNILSYRAYEYDDENNLVGAPFIRIDNANADIIAVRLSETEIKFFWRTQVLNEGKEMLFTYKDMPFISKVYKERDGSLLFFLRDNLFRVPPKLKGEVVFIGVHFANLEKDYKVKGFFWYEMNYQYIYK